MNGRGRCGSKLASHAFITGAESRAGSEVMNTTWVWACTWAGSCCRAWPRSAMVVGQMSGQCVYPK